MMTIKLFMLLLCSIFSSVLLGSCSAEDEISNKQDEVKAVLEVGRNSYSFGNAYWACKKDGSRNDGDSLYDCELEFFSFDYYRTIATGKSHMPSKFSFMVISFKSDVKLENLSSMIVKGGEWSMQGAINMPKGDGESEYYLAEAGDKPNSDLMIERHGDTFTITINRLFVDFERGNDHSWFIIENPFVFTGSVTKVPERYQ